jgi:deoxycytidylate deaminase
MNNNHIYTKLTNTESDYDFSEIGMEKENEKLQNQINKNLNNTIILALYSKLLVLQKLSPAKNKQVACIAYDMNLKTVLLESVNSPAKRKGKCEDSRDTLSDVVHAETKILLDLDVDSENINNILLLCTDSPCMKCASNMVYRNIKYLIIDRYHKNNYHSILFLIANGVQCYKISKIK